jgi:hypothetical protein
MAIVINGKTYQSSSLGFIIVLLVVIACFILWMLGRGDFTLALIAALAIAWLIG